MSDTPQGPGWWQASDDKWYPPPRPDMPDDHVVVQPESPPLAYEESPPVEGMPGMSPDPYGDVAYVEPPPTGPNRGLLYGALGVVGVLAVIAVAVLLLSGGDGDSGTETDDTAEAASDQGSGDCGADSELGDGVVLLDCGFSNFTGSSTNGMAPLPTFGFVIENTGDTLLESLQFTVTLYDEAGEEFDTQNPFVNVLQPGEKMGVGYTALSMDGGTTELADIDISYDGLAPLEEDREIGEGALVTSNVQTTLNETEPSLSTTFNVSSTYLDEVQNPVTYLIYRNSEDEILGGYQGFSPTYIGAQTRASGSIKVYGELEGMDPEGTLTYVDFGY